VSRSDLVDKIDETGCCDRLFGQVVVTCYLYRFVEVQVGAWLMHLFMVQVDYRLMVYSLGIQVDAWFRLLVQVVWCRLIGTGLQQYISQ
jgi:uncharacterized membrane protein AbrB (regulator of aidB expression)